MYKKITLLLIVSLFCVSSAYADLSSADGKLDFSGNSKTTSGDTLVIGLSPKVGMYYVSNGATETDSQWFAISSAHPGGNRAFGTAQDVNNIFNRDYDTASEMSTYLQSIPTVAESETAWTDASWNRD